MAQIKFYVIGLLVAFLSITSLTLQSKLSDATSKVEYLQGEVQYKQAEVTHLADALEFGEAQHKAMIAERNRLAQMRIEHDKERERLRNQLASTQDQINQLRQSDNEHIKEWASTTIPNDACSLFQFAKCTGRIPDSDSDGTGLPDTAQRYATALHTHRAF